MSEKDEALACCREEALSAEAQATEDKTPAPGYTCLGSASTASIPGGEETVLVADDEPSIRNLVSYVLQREGYRVLQAANGVDALSVTSKHIEEPIDLLVTDVAMPKMDGIELAGQLRIIWPNIRVLFISAEFIDPQKVLGFGGKFLAKPFTLSALTIMVHEILPRI
jgi:DNA-binding response OmpR family regulator